MISRSRLPIFRNHTRLVEIPIPAQKEPYFTMEKEPCCTCKRALQSKEPLDCACRCLTTILGSSKFQYLKQKSTTLQWKKSFVLHTKESKEPCCTFKRALQSKEPMDRACRSFTTLLGSSKFRYLQQKSPMFNGKRALSYTQENLVENSIPETNTMSAHTQIHTRTHTTHSILE